MSASRASTASTSRARIAAPWREDEREQTLCGVDLRVQVDEQLGLEDRAHDGVLSHLTRRAGRARPMPPAPIERVREARRCIGAAYGPSASELSFGSISLDELADSTCSKPSAAL